MQKLIDDILTFLGERGINCSTAIVGGYKVIKAVRRISGDEKTILPVEIIARDIKQAAIQAEEVTGFIQSIDIYPLIITEDRWRSQKQMMQERLLAHLEIYLQVYARNCDIRRIEKPEAQEFLERNHSYGYAKCKYHYGIYIRRTTGHLKEKRQLEPGTLVAVAAFSNARKWTKGDVQIRSYEWTRYASLPGLRISGGMGKVLKCFIEEINPDDIMSYADLEWSEGFVYQELGFNRESFKSAVDFTVERSDWKRRPVSKDSANDESDEDILYFRNFGSHKYRLKLTAY